MIGFSTKKQKNKWKFKGIEDKHLKIKEPNNKPVFHIKTKQQKDLLNSTPHNYSF